MTTESIIFIHGLQISAKIGIYPHEYDAHQPIYIDISLNVEDKICPVQDQLEETIDYERIAKIAEEIALENHVQLVETLAHRIANACLEQDSRIKEITLKIEKPNALSDAKGAGIVLSKKRS